MAKTTVQFEITIARRGQMTTVIRERTFPSDAVFQRWLELPNNQGNVNVLRFLDDRTQAQEA